MHPCALRLAFLHHQFQSNVPKGVVVSGPDFRPWATLPSDFSVRRAHSAPPTSTASLPSTFSLIVLFVLLISRSSHSHVVHDCYAAQHSRAFTTEHRGHHRTAGHYANAYQGPGDDGLPALNSSFGKHGDREQSSRHIIRAVTAAQR
eukprot:SAG11_NODE_2915_length_2841_cov_1.755653_5_plen_147_part_00